MLLIFPQTPLRMMLRDSDGASMRLLGLLVLSSLCSAMLQPNSTSVKSSEEDPPTRDPNTYRANSAAEDPTDMTESSESLERPWPPVPHSGLPRMFSTQHGDNMTDGSMTSNPAMFPTPDAALCDMLLNAPVPPPVDQIPFFCLCSHCKGTTGPKGNRGDRGPPGSPGSPGIRGMTGFTGQRGFTGPQGIKGQKGDMGEKGNPGSAGLTGMKGGRGFKGEKGDGGMEGPPGAQGPQGEAGTCPASCDSVQGPPGPQGSPGAAGARGLPGVQGPMGSKGLKGYKGDPGRPGDHGMDGLKGDQGEQGVCECTDGADGADGKTGEKGTKGVKGEMGTKGAQGTMGLKGNPGAMGPMGLRGPCSPAIQSAFSARINMSFPIQDLPVPFPHVFTNQQGHFNPLMGVYTAPINGTYVFSFHLAVAVRILKVGLFLNYYPLVRTTEATDRSTASHTIVLHLTMGDQVWLQVKNNITNGMFTDDESSSTFSGYLLHPDSCDLPLVRNGGMGPSSQMGAFSWNGPKGGSGSGGGGGGRTTPTTSTTPQT